MNFGEKIYRLRTARNLSQEELGELLGVSRQSISKYENNSAVPDLDRVVKLAEIFGVSLDELVRGEKAAEDKREENMDSPQGKTQAETQAGAGAQARAGARVEIPTGSIKAAAGFPGRKLAGIILLCMAFLAELVFVVKGDWLAGLALAIPFVLCGLICFLFRRHVGLWCFWAAWMYVDVWVLRGIGAHWSEIGYIIKSDDALMINNRLIVSWVQFLVMVFLVIFTVWRCGREPMRPGKKQILSLVVLWGIAAVPQVLLMLLPYTRSYYNILIYIMAIGPVYAVIYALVDWCRVIAFTAAVSNTVRYCRGRHWF